MALLLRTTLVCNYSHIAVKQSWLTRSAVKLTQTDGGVALFLLVERSILIVQELRDLQMCSLLITVPTTTHCCWMSEFTKAGQNSTIIVLFCYLFVANKGV